MKLIVVEDIDGGIGKDGKLLVSIPSDMKHFREETLGKTVVMGRSTLESFPGGKPLPKRRNIVLSTRLPISDSYEVCRSISELFELLNNDAANIMDSPREFENLKNTDDVYVIGGGQVYELLLKYCDTAIVTELEQRFEADTFIPVFAKLDDWILESRSNTITENDVSYSFATYRRK